MRPKVATTSAAQRPGGSDSQLAPEGATGHPRYGVHAVAQGLWLGAAQVAVQGGLPNPGQQRGSDQPARAMSWCWPPTRSMSPTSGPDRHSSRDGHCLFDGSGMVGQALTTPFISQAGDTFTMRMHNDEIRDYARQAGARSAVRLVFRGSQEVTAAAGEEVGVTGQRADR
jgi:hypothetical protein